MINDINTKSERKKDMGDFFTKEQMQEARMADLHEYLLTYHDDEFIRESSCIHLRDNYSLAIKRGYSGYYDFATGEHGNSVDFLTRYMGYGMVEAVLALCGDSYGGTTSSYERYTEETDPPELEDIPVEFPEPLNGSYRHLFAYLMKREIPQETIQMLIDKELLYQEAEHNNIVFINKARDFAEIRGTYTYGKGFHGCRKKKPDRFWYFCSHDKADVAYVCEAAIDAISLYVLHQREGRSAPAYYVSIAGVANQQTIDRIKSKIRTIIAVDNDEAGSKCRRRNQELESVIPKHKDWNEDLQCYWKDQLKDSTKKPMPEEDTFSLIPMTYSGPLQPGNRMFDGWKRYELFVTSDQDIEQFLAQGYKYDEIDSEYLLNEHEKILCLITPSFT